MKLQHILFLLLLLPGIVPLLLSSFYLLGSNREALKDKEKELLTLSAQEFARLVSDDLTLRAAQLRQVGHGLVAAPGFGNLEQRLREDWARRYLERFANEERRDLRAFQVVNQDGRGPGSALEALEPAVRRAMDEAFEQARSSGEIVYRFALLTGSDGGLPAVAMAVPVSVPASGEMLILRALVPVALRPATASQAGLDLNEILLIDAGGKLLWSANQQPGSDGPQDGIERALLDSELVQEFAALPVNATSELELSADGRTQSTLAQVVPVHETGWGVVAHKTTRVAFQQVQQLVLRILAFSALAVMLALGIALVAARGFSLPIQRLAEASHEIAAGHFDRRVSTEGLSFEVAKLAEDFNRMSDTVESYVERLQRAAEVNRQLFISSIRAFAAAIDAKDPYTRGHSERVASYSRAIARYLGLPKDVQEKVWISAVLHDVGKIGVEDRVLKKHGVLTPEEYEQMKLHPVIGADIVEPISALRDHLPGIRWHHEAWNGTGYPDALKGEQIPLIARIIGVADTFDAITTNRPYQTASSPEFALQTIKKLTGTRFDARIVTAFLLAWDAGQITIDASPSQVAPAEGAVPAAGPASVVPPKPAAPKPAARKPAAPQPAAPEPAAPEPAVAPAAVAPPSTPPAAASRAELRQAAAAAEVEHLPALPDFDELPPPPEPVAPPGSPSRSARRRPAVPDDSPVAKLR